MLEKEYLLVTGSSSGMGEEIAVQLSQKYNIILNGRDENRLISVYSRLQKGKHIIWRYDLSNVDTLEKSLEEILEINNIYISYFVHSAGFMKMYPIKMLSAKIFSDSFNINIVSAALITKVLASNKNKKSLKSAVFISSNISNFGAKAFSVYSSAKSGLDGLMRSLSIELSPKIRINSVLPGGVRTRMTEHMYEDEELIQRMSVTYPLGLGNVTDIYHVVRFLLSDEARWITGQQVIVDGGRTVNITG